jgi:hypothetical protein
VKEYEVAVEFGFNFKYYTVVSPRVETGGEAKQYVWDELLFDDQKDYVSSMEVVGERELTQEEVEQYNAKYANAYS